MDGLDHESLPEDVKINAGEDTIAKKGKSKQDLLAWGISMLFIIAWLGGMWAWGEAKGWNAQSGYYYENVNNTQQRFLPEPFGCNDTTTPGRAEGECTATWYFWQLPPDEVSSLTQAIVWLFYCAHQIFVWALIYRAQLVMTFRKKGIPKYQTKLRWFNWSLLIVNAIFHVLHLIQTHWTYDATAQDVAISSSQASVIMMICFILLMEYKDRGVIMMWPNPKSDDKFAKYLRLNLAPIELIRKYHGIAFSWAVTYTFWYHPMENTWGHTTGFFHTAIVLLQGSLIYTDMHLNRYWRLLNEVWVFAHGTVVAFQTSDPVAAGGSSAWPIFTFGFGFVLAFTQVYSLPFWKKISPYFRIIPVLTYLTIVLILCGTVVQGKEPGQTGFGRLYEMFFIPGEEYMMLFASWFFIYVFIQIESAIYGGKPVPVHNEASATKQAFYIGFVVLIYALFIFGSYLARNLTYSLIGMMIIFVFIFSFGVCITVLFFKQLMGPFRKMAHGCSGATLGPKTDENANTAGAVNVSYIGEAM